jgi:peptidoglycan hydrolase-like protein with peptidoglycan-binding domain
VSLQRGDTGDDVAAWQFILAQRGYHVPESGIYDTRTEYGTRVLQAGAGLARTGIVDDETRAAALLT